MQLPTLTEIIFYGAAGLAVLSALLVILLRDAVRSALFLVLTFFCLAVLYVLMNAQFVAAVQVIVYAGAVMVLFLFVVMLLNTGAADEKPAKFLVRKAIGFLAGGLVLAQLLCIALSVKAITGVKGIMTAEVIEKTGSTQAVGWALFSDYVYPFEAVSVLLLMAIIGSVVLAKKKL